MGSLFSSDEDNNGKTESHHVSFSTNKTTRKTIKNTIMNKKAKKAAYNKYENYTPNVSNIDFMSKINLAKNEKYFENEPRLIQEYLNKYSGNSIITRFRRWWNDVSEELNDEDHNYLRKKIKNVNERRKHYHTRKNEKRKQANTEEKYRIAREKYAGRVSN